MRVLEQVEAFFGRKRPLRYIALALLLAGLGHLLESRTALGWVAQGQMLTRSIGTQLRAVQPFAIADKYHAESADRRGLWFCATDREILVASNPFIREALERNLSPQAIDQQTNDRLPDGKTKCSGWINIVRLGVTTVMATPAVVLAVWNEGGWVNRLLLPFTLLGIAAALVAMWGSADGGAPLPQTMGVLAIGPILMGGVFWLALWVLLALIWAFGNVLAGLTWVIATFAGMYKVVTFCVGILKTSDGIADQHRTATGPAPAPTPTDNVH